jgi:hypothetical protein
LRQQAEDKKAELLTLLKLSPIEIWNTDLDLFLQEWDVSDVPVLFLFPILNPWVENMQDLERHDRFGLKRQAR